MWKKRSSTCRSKWAAVAGPAVEQLAVPVNSYCSCLLLWLDTLDWQLLVCCCSLDVLFAVVAVVVVVVECSHLLVVGYRTRPC